MDRSVADTIADFLAAGPYAVVGASRDPAKYGNKVLRAYMRRGWTVYPVNPHAREVEGLAAYPNLAALPERVRAISVITPPAVTEQVVEDAAWAGVALIWMQPGAESAAAVARGRALGLAVIADGSCFLVHAG